MTIEVHMMNEREARVITEQIRISAHNYTEARTKLMERVQEAKDGNAHFVLGYASWTAYLSEVLGEEPMRLARDERQDMVRMLANEGMSTRAIAPIVGVKSDQTIRADLAATKVRDRHAPAPEPEPSPLTDEPGQVIKLTGSNSAASPGEDLPKSEKIIGMDGKEYKRPEPKPGPVEPPKPKRRPITDQARDAGWEIRKATERIERILKDDRFARNKEEMATSMRGHLEYVIESCQGFLDQINN